MKPLFLFLISASLVMACAHRTLSPAGNNKMDPDEVLRLVNRARAKGCRCGGRYYQPAPALQQSAVLESAARDQSEFMASVNKLQHTGKNGALLSERLNAKKYPWVACAENIAMGQRSEAEVVNSWLQSPMHCKNIMNPSLKEMGAWETRSYWTLLLASR